MICPKCFNVLGFVMVVDPKSNPKTRYYKGGRGHILANCLHCGTKIIVYMELYGMIHIDLLSGVEIPI